MVGRYAAYLSMGYQTQIGAVVLANQATATDMLDMMLTRRARTQSWAED